MKVSKAINRTINNNQAINKLVPESHKRPNKVADLLAI